MPLTASFTASQTIGFPSIVTITDTSTGSDGAVVGRRVFLTTGYNTFLVPSGTTTSYIAWSILNTSINIDALDKDYALQVTVQWVDVNGNVLYTDSNLYGFTLYNEQFLYNLTQHQTSEYQIIQDITYYSNKEAMRVEIDSGNQAVSLARDLAGAQSCYDRATYMRVNENKFF